ncbi:MAG: Holliday junction branch migration protein RuvA [Elusimicrobia bacterium]|jgi:Holliday junction DNA helicase RuvA|nr:Holliday junction branch migration protein RuvA [Elusimicrobiota bacterium]
MYIYIKGKVIEKSQDDVVVETGGLGYILKIGALTFNDLPAAGEDVKLNTYHYLREDREELYGFSTKGEKELFEILIGVSNIGPAKAMDILSAVSPAHFVDYIINNNINGLSSLKGIGRKTAKRLVLELKDKIKEIKPAGDFKKAGISNYTEAVSGLKGLGYKESVARDLIDAAKDDIKEGDEPQNIIRKALKNAG